MFRRVWLIEGFQGLYKGLMPTLITALIVSLSLITFVDSPRHRPGAYRAPVAGVLGTLVYGVGMMVLSLPSAILTCTLSIFRRQNVGSQS